MDPVIYSANVIQAFLGPLGTTVFIFGIAVVGLLAALLRTRERPGIRIGLVLTGGFLLIVGCAMSFFTYRAITSGAKVVNARLKDKTVAQDNCGNGNTCARYVLEMTAGAKSLDLNIARSAFDRAQIGTCYQVTYYPANGMFSDPALANSYESVSNIARVEATKDSACSP